MIIESKINSTYNIKCNNCGQIIQKHKTYCKQYGDEYWFNPPLVCPSCGESDKVARLGKDYKEINEEKSQPNNSNTIPVVKPTNNQSKSQISNNNNYQANGYPTNSNTSTAEKDKISFIDRLKYAKDINQHIEEATKLKEELAVLKDKLQSADGVVVSLNLKISELETQIRDKEKEIIGLKALLTDDHYRAMNIKKHLAELSEQEADALHEVLKLEDRKQELSRQVIELDDELLYQSFGLYKPLYDFANSTRCKERLEAVRQQQKEMIKNKTAVSYCSLWTVNGSKSQGTMMTNDNIKQILRCFNAECENVIDRVKFNNYDSMSNRITRSFEALNKLNEVNMISIEEKYLNLKFEELNLAYQYQMRKQDEKEDLRILREQQREDAKVAREIEEKRREIEKEQQHYENALSRLNDQIDVEKNETRLEFLLEKKKEIEENLVDLDIALKEVDYREANQRAGYVYIISNIGAFGENVYKIGMTRRLDPQERVDELGNASVPFKYDIHAMIFSDDAPKLESALHRAFENKRINAINNRKEFFRVTLAEIDKVVKENHDKTVDFINTSPAQQYRETLKIRDNSI